MARLKVLQDTFLKLSTAQASDLPNNEKQAISTGTVLVLHSYADAPNNHIKVAFRDDVFQGHNTWYAFADHVDIVEVNSIPSLPPSAASSEQPLPADVKLTEVPHLNQLTNKFAPTGTCNITCCAMVLESYGIEQRKKGVGFEDELFLFMASKGWDRHVHSHLVKLLQEYGLDDEFTVTAGWNAIKHHLANGNPVICAGDFTASGHIIVLSGYNSQGFIVQDPNGEIFWSPGRNYPLYVEFDEVTDSHNTLANPHRGADLIYSYNLMDTLAGPNGRVWAHFPRKG